MTVRAAGFGGEARATGEKDEREKADACTECGECEEKCPQKIKIMEKLKECHQALG